MCCTPSIKNLISIRSLSIVRPTSLADAQAKSRRSDHLCHSVIAKGKYASLAVDVRTAAIRPE